MDFMKWLGSLDELLYEIMSWLLFFPLTLWRSIVHPFETVAQVGRQAELPEAKQYSALLSPPLFLSLALLPAHAVATALGQTDVIIANKHGLASLVNDNASALVLRVIIFAAFPLFLAARLVRAQHFALDRSTLRQPFYEQCFPTAVFALGLSVGFSFAQVQQPGLRIVGEVVIALTILNYVAVEVRWMNQKLQRGLVRAVANVVAGLVQGFIFLLVVGFLFTR